MNPITKASSWLLFFLTTAFAAGQTTEVQQPFGVAAPDASVIGTSPTPQVTLDKSVESSPWTFAEAPDEKIADEIRFKADKTLTLLSEGKPRKKYHRNWELVGPLQIKISWNDSKYFLLTFDAAMNRFEGATLDGALKVTGTRKSPVAKAAAIPQAAPTTPANVPPPSGTPAPEASLKSAQTRANDPFVGRWRSGGHITQVEADGTFYCVAPRFHDKGTWKYLSSPDESAQLYELNYGGGRSIVKIRLSLDHNRAYLGDRPDWTRVTEQ